MITRHLHNLDTIETVEANHNGWIWRVGKEGWALLDTKERIHRKDVHWPGFLMRKRPGIWCKPGENYAWLNIGETLEAAYVAQWGEGS